MYPVLQPIDWKHFAPTELRNNSELWFYKHFVPTGLFKKAHSKVHNDLGKISNWFFCWPPSVAD